jgi:hypothetical protein
MNSSHLESSQVQVERDSTGPPDIQDPQLTLRLLTDAITRLTALAATPQISSDGGFGKLVESNDVPKFKGNTKDHRRFLTKLNMVFALSPATFSTDEKKILFAGKRMEGAAEEWFDGVMLVSLLPDITDPAVVSAKAVMTNWDAFIQAFRIFEDPQLQQHLEDELDALKQTGSAANYAASFRAIAYQLPVNDYTRATRFYKGLKDDVKDRICEEGRATTFDLLVMQATGIDARLFARRQEQKRNNNNSKQSLTSTTNTLNQTQANKNGYASKTVSIQSQGNRQNPISPPSRPTFVPFAPASSTQVIPMDIDATRATVKAYRKANNLCFYCGGPHRIDACPTKPPGKHVAVNATSTVVAAAAPASGNATPAN